MSKQTKANLERQEEHYRSQFGYQGFYVRSLATLAYSSLLDQIT